MGEGLERLAAPRGHCTWGLTRVAPSLRVTHPHTHTHTHTHTAPHSPPSPQGITPEAEKLLKALPGPLFIVAFTGYGRSGKSFTASRIRNAIVGDGARYTFASAPGNVPCTHGIDMMVFPHPLSGACCVRAVCVLSAMCAVGVSP
jgi:hypothetical protein